MSYTSICVHFHAPCYFSSRYSLFLFCSLVVSFWLCLSNVFIIFARFCSRQLCSQPFIFFRSLLFLLLPLLYEYVDTYIRNIASLPLARCGPRPTRGHPQRPQPPSKPQKLIPGTPVGRAREGGVGASGIWVLKGFLHILGARACVSCFSPRASLRSHTNTPLLRHTCTYTHIHARTHAHAQPRSHMHQFTSWSL